MPLENYRGYSLSNTIVHSHAGLPKAHQNQKCTDETLDMKFDIIFDGDIAKIKEEK